MMNMPSCIVIIIETRGSGHDADGSTYQPAHQRSSAMKRIGKGKRHNSPSRRKGKHDCQCKERKENKRSPVENARRVSKPASTTKRSKRNRSPRQRGNRPTKAFDPYKWSRDSPRYTTKPSMQCGKREIINVHCGKRGQVQARIQGISVEVCGLWSKWKEDMEEEIKTTLTSVYTTLYSCSTLIGGW